MIEVLNFNIAPSKTRVGTLLIQYHHLIIKCDMVVWKNCSNEGHLWVRMPECWFTPEKKTTFCYWNTEENSADFQKIVLKKVFDVYAFDYAKALDVLKKKSGKKSST